MRTKYLLSGTAVAAIAAAAVLNSALQEDSARAYSPKLDDKKEVTGANGARELFIEMNKNTQTGQVEYDDLRRAVDFANQLSASRVTTLGWVEEGPDNIGGRTRAILVDRNNRNHLFAGSVSGGLFVSNSRANTWQKVDGFSDVLAVSSLAQTVDGTIYAATGHSSDNFGGGGVFKSTDNGVTWTVIPGTENWTFVNEIRADNVSNKLWIGQTSGTGMYTYDGSNLSQVTGTGLPGGSVLALDVSPDGQVIVCHVGSATYVSTNGGTNFSVVSAGGSNPIPTNGGRNEYAISHERVNGEYRIYCSQAFNWSAGTNGSRLKGIFVSENSGQDWFEIAPGWAGGTPSFQPFSTSLGAQGLYDNIIGVAPGNPERAFIGGIDLYRWDQGASNPPFGQFEQISVWFANPTSSTYAHADQHEMTWDDYGRLYVGNDGGVHSTDNEGDSWMHMNRGYNVTQFYSVAYSAQGDVMGGTQDNGTLHNDHTNSTWKEHREVRGGDGFDCDISFYNRDIMVSSVYYTSIARSADRGVTWSSAGLAPDDFTTYSRGNVGTSMGSFQTVMRLAERYDDYNSTDTIIFPVFANYNTGDEVPVPGFSTGDTLYVTATEDLLYDDTVCHDPGLTTVDTAVVDAETGNTYYLGSSSYNFLTGGADASLTVGDSIRIQIIGANYDTIAIGSIFTYDHYFGYNPIKNKYLDMGTDTCVYGVAWDTLHVQDPHQSWFAVAIRRNDNGNVRSGIFITRELTRFATTNIRWHLVADSISMGGGRITCLEFDRNMDVLYAGTSTGQVWRIKYFNEVYSSTPDAEADSLIGGWLGNNSPLNHAPYRARKERIYQDPQNRSISGIGVDYQPGQEGHIVLAIGSSNGTGHVQESFTADTDTLVTGVGSFSSIAGSLPASLPVYDAVIDRDNPSQIVIGTYAGVYVTDNGGTTWNNASGDFGNVPVYAVRQDWRTWSEGSHKPGTIYIGTFGRGIWSTGDLLGTNDPKEFGENDRVELMKAFPNPSTDITNLRFDLDEKSEVNIRVYNIMGGLMKTVRPGTMSAGTNELTLDVSDLPVGTYLIQLRAGDQVEVAKFIRARK